MLVAVNQMRHQKRIYLVSVLILAIFSILAIGLDRIFLPKTGVLLILQAAVVIISIIATRKMSIFSGFFCALVYNYFFTAPVYSLHMTDAQDIINTIVFLTVAFITSQFADSYRTQSEALKQAEIRTNILLSVSHDLRTPLSGIIGNLSTFLEYRDKIAREQSDELVAGALAESHRLHRYIENLLQATKLQNQSVNLSCQQQSIWPILQKVAKRFDSPRVILNRHSEQDIVSIQGSLVEQAIYNLVDNALKYSAEDTEVVLECDRVDEQVIVNIHDDGPGVDESMKSRMFDLFYSKRMGDQGEGGSGIGLTVAKGIVEAHGGRLQVLDKDTGLTMQVTLPFCDEEQG